MSNLSVGVVGAGMVGLSTAINVQKLMKHVNVTVVADAFGTDTHRQDQMGLFLPVPSRMKGVDSVTAKEWLMDGYHHHFAMADGPEGPESGHHIVGGWCMFTDTSGQQNVPIPDLVRNLRELTDEEKTNRGYNWDYVCYFETVLIDIQKYTRWLMKEFRQNGGSVMYRTVDCLQELYGMFDVVVNCCGRRTREAVVDPHFTFINTRTVQITREVSTKFILDDKICMIPHLNSSHRWDITWSPEPKSDTDDVIMEDNNARTLLHVAMAKVPNLQGCEKVTEWVETTAYREPPLVEIEMIRCVRGKGPILPVVHNVGHGPEYCSLAWGTGAQAAQLVQECHRLVRPFVPFYKPLDPRT